MCNDKPFSQLINKLLPAAIHRWINFSKKELNKRGEVVTNLTHPNANCLYTVLFEKEFEGVREEISSRLNIENIPDNVVGDVIAGDDSCYSDGFYRNYINACELLEGPTTQGGNENDGTMTLSRKSKNKHLGKRLHSEHYNLWQEMTKRFFSYVDLKILVSIYEGHRYWEVEYDDVVSYMLEHLKEEEKE